MKKLTLLTAALAFMSLTANADDKVIYQDNFTNESASLENWLTSRDGSVTKIVSTSDGSYIQFGDGATSYNGTRHNCFWGEEPWTGIELPESGYKMTFMFNFELFGNNSSNAAQRNNEIAIVDAASIGNDLGSYYGNAVDIFPNYLFKITQVLTGDAAGDGGYCSAANGTCNFTINNEEDPVTIAASTWYRVTLDVAGHNVNYDITDISGNALKSGSYTLSDEADNRAGGIIHYQARYLGITDIMDIKMTYEVDGDVAQTPLVVLDQVKNNDRIYKATFLEDETLHYILPGSTTEEEVEYWDAEDEVSGDPGVMRLTATQSGTLKVWTTKRDAVSEVVEMEVECGVITLPAPVAAIASVSEGFGKVYTISVDNQSVLLAPTVALTYTINYVDGATETGEIDNGSKLELTKAGTLTVVVNSIPNPVTFEEYYARNSVTVNNDVEYVVAQDVNYQAWTTEELDKNGAFEAGTLVDGNTSHWIGHWMNTLDENGAPLISDPETPLPIYTLINDEAGVNYATALLPLKMNTARGNIAILVEEGIFINGTSYNNGEVYFDESYITDDPAKPNFMEITKTSSYDRYDKQESCHTVDIVKTDDTSYLLYRFDTAINRARIFTYKGFVPGTSGINNAVVEKEFDVNAPIYTLSGVRVANANAKGVYIQGGKKFVVK